MSRQALREYLVITVTALAAALGFTLGALLTPTTTNTTYLDCAEPHLYVERATTNRWERLAVGP